MTRDESLLLAYDGSGPAKAAIVDAARLFPGRSAVVVTVWASVAQTVSGALLALPDSVARGAAEKIDAEAEREARALAGEGAGLAAEAGLEASALAVRCERNVWATIVRLAAEQDAAAVVVGSRGRSGIKSMLLGSVSSGVVQNASCPVVVAHERPPPA